ncbi:YciI family protein [Kitasatospora sp. NPDC047058]|uniref:YciI family protein n=1 Tax=Kitasatospora sp. NPDC047058 TaxID=3155620 RepID=UPI0033DA8AC2
MAQYLILVYRDEATVAGASQEDWDAALKEHRSFQERNATAILGGNALHFTDTATSIRRNGSGGLAVTDGPFAETKEALGGYYLVEAADLDEAIGLAKQVPDPFGGGVEVRPVRVFD